MSIDGSDLVALASLLVAAIALIRERTAAYRTRLYDERLAAARELGAALGEISEFGRGLPRRGDDPGTDDELAKRNQAYWDQVEPMLDRTWRVLLKRAAVLPGYAINAVVDLVQTMTGPNDEHWVPPFEEVNSAEVALVDALRDMVGVEALGKELEQVLRTRPRRNRGQ